MNPCQDDGYVLIIATTLMAFFYKDGIMFGLDKRATVPSNEKKGEGGSTAKRIRRWEVDDDFRKWFPKGNIIVTFSGSTIYTEWMENWLLVEGNWPQPMKKQHCERYSVDDVADKIIEGMEKLKEKWNQFERERKEEMGMTSIIAGWSHVKGGLALWELKTSYNTATDKFDTVKVERNIAFGGSGSEYAAVCFERQEKGTVKKLTGTSRPYAMWTNFTYNMEQSEEYAKEMVFRCFYETSINDEYTGGSFVVLKVNNDLAEWLCEKKLLQAAVDYFECEKTDQSLLMACTDSEEYEDVYLGDFETQFRGVVRAIRISSLTESNEAGGFYLYRVMFESENFAVEAMKDADPNSSKEGGQNWTTLFEKRKLLDTSRSQFPRSKEEEGRLQERLVYLNWYSKDLLTNLGRSYVKSHKLRRRY